VAYMSYERNKFETNSGIYRIKNMVTNNAEDCYIGSALNIQRRLDRHHSELKTNSHPNQILQRAIDKYGIENFDFEVVEFVHGLLKLKEREQYYLDTIKPRYNISPSAENNRGWIASEETRKKQSLRHKELWKDPVHRINMLRGVRAATAKILGTHPSSEHLAKVTAANRRNLANPEVKAKLSEASKSMWASPEFKERMREKAREAAKKRWKSPEYRIKFSAARKKDKMPANVSDKQRQHLSEAGKAKKPWLSEANKDPERMAKVKEGRERYWAEYRRKKAEQDKL
jgi:group I intron endonuclease